MSQAVVAPHLQSDPGLLRLKVINRNRFKKIFFKCIIICYFIVWVHEVTMILIVIL